MSNHKVIFVLISNLSKNEEYSFKKDLRNKGESEGKLLKLFVLMRSKRVSDIDKVVLSLYGDVLKNNLEAYRKICDRMLSKLLNLIANFENFQMDKAEYSEYFFNKIFVNRNIYLFQVLRNKFLPTEFYIKQIQATLKICYEYELLEESVILEKILIIYLYEKGDLDKQDFYLKEISLFTKYIDYLSIAENYTYRYIEHVQHKSIDDKSKVTELESAIKQLELYFKESNLQSINYYYLMLQLQLAHYVENYNLAEEIILEIIRISEYYSSLKRKGRVIQNYMNLAYTQFFIFKFNDAYVNALKASVDTKDKDLFLNVNREACVFALIYLNRYPEAEEWMAKILSSGAEGNSPEQLSKRHLMMGVLKYLQQDYKGAFKHLQFTKQVETDREGWNLGIRMLNIYLTLSTEKVDLADQRINAMRKHIERTSKMRNLRKRDIIIFRILSHLSRSGFDFHETWSERKKDFTLLRSKTPDCFWVPRSHELIIFDQWFEAKMKNIPYAPVFPQPQHAPDPNVEISMAEGS